MDFIKNCWNKIKEPHGLLLALFYIVFVITVTLTIVVLVIAPNNFFNYFLYLGSAICLAYFVYTIFYFTPKIKAKIINILCGHSFTKAMLDNYDYRTIIFSVFSCFVNLCFVVFQGVLAVVTKSWWYITITIYYILLSFAKGLVLLSQKKYKENTLNALKTYRFVGIILTFLMLAFSGVIVLIYKSDRYFEYAGMLIYVVSAFTFYKVTLAVYNIIKAKKQNNIFTQCFRNINLSASLISLLVLQIAMFKAFSPESNTGFANALTGAGVAIIIISIGIYMIVSSTKKLKNQKEKNNE